ncbi:MAG: hypothetical protein GXO62_01890 [Epsilonproteobacteria bacterium]|nr:hypothetical protein [Campylobacterota bacterium]
MIGHIDYLNLLPFYQFLKKKDIQFKKSYPAKINELFEKRKISAAFVSSVKSKNKKCFDVGIAANKEVKSVLLCKGSGEDKESATSNVLAKVLGVKGRVVIGDKAFREKGCVDLAKEWNKKYHLPFVFARFCVNKNPAKYKKLIDEFQRKKIYIPYRVIKQYAQKTGISPKEAKEYLQKNIYYKLGWREKKALKKFLFLSRKFS